MPGVMKNTVLRLLKKFFPCALRTIAPEQAARYRPVGLINHATLVVVTSVLFIFLVIAPSTKPRDCASLSAMKILFVHQNYPGQYREILPRLAATGQHKIVFLTQRTGLPAPRDHAIAVYKPDHVPADNAYPYTRWFEQTTGAGVGVAKACGELKKRGFTPDIAVGHVGWGEMTFIKEIWPDVPVVGYFEYYFLAEGGCLNYDPEFPERLNIAALLRARNAMNYLSYMAVDAGHTASQWQKETYPSLFHDKISVMHEGVRADLLTPDHDSPITVTLDGHAPFSRDDELVTYIARNLEPIRGVHSFMRCLPMLQKARPNVRVAVIGGDDVSYGAKLGDGDSYRARLTRELGDKVDWTRVHFLGRVAYPQLIDLIRLARCHLYLTVPFVVSWSMLEAMALEKTVVASDVKPVRAFMEHGKTGLLVDFLSPEKIAQTIAGVLAHRDNNRDIGTAARAHVLKTYDFQSVCYPQFIELLNSALPKGKKIPIT